MPKVSFNNSERLFYSSLKLSVDEYFEKNHLKKTGNGSLYLKTLILISSAVAIYCILLFVTMPAFAGILLSGLFGFILACIGFNVMHDACHGSYSGNKQVNEIMGLTLNALGGNAFMWKFKHNILHHTYPNVDGIDDDIEKSPFIRLCTTQKWLPLHRFQHMYVSLVYAITSVAWVFIMDFKKYFTQKVVNTPLQKMDSKEHVIFWTSKILYLFFYIAMPVYIVGWKHWAIGFITFNVVMGFTLAIVFQLAHVVEHVQFEHVGSNDSIRIEDEWAIYQVKATADFATSNKVISWFLGGLNFQVEHHLFPKISHVHYQGLNKILRQTCRQHHVAYNEFATIQKAIASHYRMMKEFGKKPS